MVTMTMKAGIFSVAPVKRLRDLVGFDREF